MSTRPILFVQGSGDINAPDGSGVLADWLGRELGAVYDVRAPAMPDADVDPRYEPWRDRIVEEIARIDGGLLLVGHSFGASVLLKTLLEQPPRQPIVGLFLVVLPDWGPDGWEYEPFAVPDAIADIVSSVPTFLYQSRDDPVVPFDHFALARAKLPHATARALPGTEHSFVHGLPQLADDIRSVAD